MSEGVHLYLEPPAARRMHTVYARCLRLSYSIHDVDTFMFGDLLNYVRTPTEAVA